VALWEAIGNPGTQEKKGGGMKKGTGVNTMRKESILDIGESESNQSQRAWEKKEGIKKIPDLGKLKKKKRTKRKARNSGFIFWCNARNEHKTTRKLLPTSA